MEYLKKKFEKIPKEILWLYGPKSTGKTTLIEYIIEKELLKEFLNFCVRLTKELHLAHVVILSSNTIFIDRIYNDAKLKATSRFKKIDHLNKKDIFEYLDYKNKIDRQDYEIVWDYLGGCIPLVQRLINEIDSEGLVKEYLENEVELALSEIIEIMVRFMNSKEKKICIVYIWHYIFI
ncbi:MAG TPA: hypothetical protein EYG93_00405 [Sulfurospirillum arcachonense]|nr:hypothetical protein [Sulfurospirillum arcachonense]